MSAQMNQLVRFGHKPHPIDTKKYGAPRLAFYWAKRGYFAKPGLYLWAFNHHLRVLPMLRREWGT